MGSPNEGDAELMRRFLARFEPEEDYSDAEIAEALGGGISGQTVTNWRAWEWTYLQKGSRRLIREYLEEAPAVESPTYSEGVRAAVDRVEATLDELRRLAEAGEDAGSLAESTGEHDPDGTERPNQKKRA